MSTKEINKIKKRREKTKKHEKKQPSPAGVSDIPPLRTLAPPSGHPPRGLAVSCGDRLGVWLSGGTANFARCFVGVMMVMMVMMVLMVMMVMVVDLVVVI